MHKLVILIKVYLGSCVQLYSLAETSQLPPSLAFGLIYEGAIGQPSLCNPMLRSFDLRMTLGRPLEKAFSFLGVKTLTSLLN